LDAPAQRTDKNFFSRLNSSPFGGENTRSTSTESKSLSDNIKYEFETQKSLNGIAAPAGTQPWPEESVLPRGVFVTSDNVQLSYIRHGSGRPIVLLHGWSQCAEQFKYQIEPTKVGDPEHFGEEGSWLSVKNPPYNAAGDGITDDTTAILNCIKDAITQHKSVWVPSGTYLVTSDITSTIPGDQGLHDVTIQGAGMWYTTFVGDPTLYTNQHRRVRFLGGGNNVNLSDFAIIGKLNYRNDAEENDGIFGFYGTGSSIRRCWVEHTKTGCWIVNSSGLIIEGCRFRDTLADGVNLAVGMQNTMVSNCSTRGTGDDCFAMWPTNYEPQTYTPDNNTFDHCTGELPFLASGGSIYGASGNSIRNCLFRDICGGSGVLISGNFPVGNNTFSGTTTISDCDMVRCGGYDINSAAWWGSIQFAMVNQGIADSGLPGMSVRNVNIIDSLSDGITIVDGQKLDNAVLTNVHIYNFGLGVPGRHSIWASPQTQGSMTINNSTLSEKYQNDSSNFRFIPNAFFIMRLTNSSVLDDGFHARVSARFQFVFPRKPIRAIQAGISM
jgi:Pectate lyase superfamily protein